MRKGGKMAAVESNRTRSADVTCGEDAMTTTTTPTTATEKADAAAPRRRLERYRFHIVDLLYYALSVSFFFADVATGHSAWGCFAMGFTILPACVTQLFSLRWHHSDGSLRTVHWLLHFLLLGFLHRYLTLLYTAMHSLRNKSSFSKDKNWVYRQESDICMLHLFESFMGATPQLILQLYIIATLHHAPFWTSASAIASFCSLTWAVNTYIRAMHNINRERSNATWIALVLQALWRGGMLLSRIGVLVLAAVFLRTWFFLFLGLHWLFMTIWVILQKTEFCPTMWEERIYNCIIGLIYCFDFFNLREGRSRYRVLVFYTVIVAQNLILLTMYTLHFKDTIANDTMIAIASVIIGGMLVGLTSMSLYYGKFHPSKMMMTNGISRNINEHSHATNTVKTETPSKSFKLFHRGSLVSLHHSIDISPRTEEGEVATDKQSLLTNIAQISDCAEEGIVNRNYNSENESNASVVRVSTECERSHSRIGGKHKEEIASNDNPDNALTGSSAPLYPGLLDIDSSRKRHGIYEHDITPQLDWHAPDILNIDLLDQLSKLDNSERNNSLSFNSCSSKVIGALDVIKNRGKLTTPTPLESSRIFDIEKQQRDETMSCVTSIHDYENVCPLGIARPPWCIRSWKGYTDIETYIHDDSVVRDRRRDTLTSTTGTTYSSEYSDGMISRGILKQDDYADALTYDLVESKEESKSAYGDNAFSTSAVGNQSASLYVAKPVVIDDRGGMLALDTILEERDDSSDEKFPHTIEPSRDSASTLVSTIDQIRRYTAENSPRHIYHITETQWEDLNPKNLMARARFAQVLFDSDLKNTSTTVDPVDLTARDVEKREIDAIREFVRCCAIESIKKTPLIDAILSDSPVLGSRANKLVRQVTFADRKNDFDANESDLYVEMSPLVSVENGENPCQTRLAENTIETEISTKRNNSTISEKSPDKENLAPIASNNNIRRINNMMYDNSDSCDRRAWTIERDDKNDKSFCSVHFNLKEKRHLFLEQVLSPVPKLWNKRISFHPSTKKL
ncbi:uncharacterized protein LOC105249101 isoform X2 [Camponotus floridanus]|uniref:uncharacterized protein LOC105249101 isoform X2 n=1 Tax=Camponotus floridanus TaxID=104421 RepID=UPI000DC69542|nr:uncharacterized protein LOC105249101 isoform X2 [Camponotus floridanus]